MWIVSSFASAISRTGSLRFNIRSGFRSPPCRVETYDSIAREKEAKQTGGRKKSWVSQEMSTVCEE